MYDLTATIFLFLLFGLGTCFAYILSHLSSDSVQSDQENFCSLAVNAPFSIWVEQNNQVVWSNCFCDNDLSHEDRPFAGIREFEKAKHLSGTQRIDIYDLKTKRPKAATSYSIQRKKMGNRTVYYAQDATQLAETESELKRFVQTLSSTFAHLPIGLAVFDKKRDLTLFNPALSHLLGLAPEWLAKRPSMRSFLDRLRNQGAIPEPKDFTTLRHEFAELESGAFTGKYEVDWALPSGSIYRVTGRPHPQGGAALLFEDVSHAAALEAEYRAELRQLYSALEALTDGIAIFDQAGELAYANDAFDKLWKCTLSSAVAAVTVNDVSRLFQKHCEPTPIWGEFRNFVHDLTERSLWHAQVVLKTGQTVQMTFSPIADGRVFCEFRVQSSDSNTAVIAQYA